MPLPCSAKAPSHDADGARDVLAASVKPAIRASWRPIVHPEDQRAVLLLVAVEDLSYSETAKVLNIPIGTVMSRLSRGRERLQQEIEGPSDDAGRIVVKLRSLK